jgi:GINS complex subunit 3
MDKGYFSVDAILAAEDRVPVVFNTTAASLGFLDPACKEEDLPARSRVELPLWLAQSLEAKNMVRLELPKHYSARFREDLLAGPEAVDIRDRSVFFYETGTALARAKRDEHLQRTMRMVFSGQRFRDILDASLNSGGDDMTDFLKDLPHAERILFNAGFVGSREYEAYKKGTHAQIGMAEVLKVSSATSGEAGDGGKRGGGGSS